MGALHLILTILAGVVLAILIAAAGKSFEEDRLTRWLKGIAGGGAFIATNLLAPNMPPAIGLLTVALPLGWFAYLFIWWSENGSSGKELLFFVLMSVMLYNNAMAAVSRVLDISSNWIARGIVMSIPGIIWLMLIAFMVSNMIAFRQKLNAMSSGEGGDDDDEER